jgi:hypothetical protein
MLEKLKDLLERAESWPEKAQEAAVASLAAIEEAYLGTEGLSADDLEALALSAEDVRMGRFATEAEMRELFDLDGRSLIS